MYIGLKNAIEELKKITEKKELTENMLIMIAKQLEIKAKKELSKSTIASVYALFNTYVLQNYGKKWRDLVLKKVTHLSKKDQEYITEKANDRNEKRKENKMKVDGKDYIDAIQELKKNMKGYDEKKDYYKLFVLVIW